MSRRELSDFWRIVLALLFVVVAVAVGIQVDKWRASLWAGQLAEQLQKQERR